MKLRKLYIGIDKHGRAVNAARTREQIDAVKKLQCAVGLSWNPESRLTWDDFDNEDEPDSLFQRIVCDRLAYEKVGIAPDTYPGHGLFAVVIARGKRVVRLEFLERCDYRAPELHGQELRSELEAF